MAVLKACLRRGRIPAGAEERSIPHLQGGGQKSPRLQGKPPAGTPLMQRVHSVRTGGISKGSVAGTPPQHRLRRGSPSPKAGSHPGRKEKLKYSPGKASGPPSLQPPTGRSGRAGSASAEGGYAVLPPAVCFLSKRYGRARKRPKKQNRRCLRHRKERFRMRLFHKTSPLSPCAALPTCRKGLVCGGNPPGCRPGNRGGLGDGAFGPAAPITREQPAAMPCRYHQRQGGVLDAGSTAARSEIAAMMQRFPAATGKQETTGAKQCGWDPFGSQPHCFVPPGALIYHGRNGRRS